MRPGQALINIFAADRAKDLRRKRYTSGTLVSLTAGEAVVDVGARLPDGTPINHTFMAADGFSGSAGSTVYMNYPNDSPHGGIVTNYASSATTPSGNKDGVTNGDLHDHYGGDGAQIDHIRLSNIGTNTHAQIDTHLADTNNPHEVTADQVLPDQTGNSGKVLGTNGTTASWTAAGAGTGDVVGPASATDGRVALFDGTTGKLLKEAGNGSMSGNLGIGITPYTQLVVSSATPHANLRTAYAGTACFAGVNTDNSGLHVIRATDTATGQRAVFMGIRSRGTLAAPTAVVSGDDVFSFFATSYDGSALVYPAMIHFKIDGAVSTGVTPTSMAIYTGTNSGTRAARITFASSGAITASGALTCTNNLQVDGVSGFGTAPTAATRVTASVTSTTDVSTKAVYAICDNTFAGAKTTWNYAHLFAATHSAVNQNYTGLLLGVTGRVSHNTTGCTISDVVAYRGNITLQETTDSTSIITRGYVFQAAAENLGATTKGTIQNYYAFYMSDLTSVSNITNKYGVYIDDAGAKSVFKGDVELGDAADIITGTSTGTKIGTATSQKLAFWNKTPIVQPTTGITGATFVNGSPVAPIYTGATFGGYTLPQIAAALIDVGILA